MPLRDAIEALSQQTGLHIGYLPRSSAEEFILVGPLKGRYTAEAALTILVTPQGLVFKRSDERTISVFAPWPNPSRRNGAGIAPESVAEKKKEKPHSRASRGPEQHLLARGESGTSAHGPDRGVLEDVLVTGTRLGHPGEGPAPVLTFTREKLDQLGVSTVAEVLKYVPQQPYVHSDGYRASGAQYAELRGLGVDTTLILINGRRVAPTASSAAVNAFDLNAVPLAMVERVEVLPASASAVYGADAMGGVVNIILKTEVPRPVLELRYGAAQGGADERRASLSAGHSDAGFVGSLMLDYFERDLLLGEERDRWRDQDYRRFGGADRRSLNANPGNVTPLTTANLPGLQSRFAAIPEGSGVAALTSADLGPTAEQGNFESLFRYWSVVPETQRASAAAFGELHLTSGVAAFGEMLHTDRKTVSQFEPTALAGAIVPASNAFNPFEVPVAVNYLLTGVGPREMSVHGELSRAVVGVRSERRAWKWELAVLASDETVGTRMQNNVDPVRLAAALASDDPERALNVFADGPGGSHALLASLIGEPVVGRYRASGAQASGFVRGSLFALPAGEVQTVLGAEWRKEKLTTEDSFSLSRDRSVSGAFGELRLPIVSRAARLPGVRELSLTLAARLDRYDDFGDAINPQYGFVWRPAADLAVRAAYGTSFRPPSLYELFGPRAEIPTQFPDPRRNNEPAVFTVVSGGNPALDPTEGESFTAGFVFTPDALSPLRVAATYWRTRIDDRIAIAAVAVLLADEEHFADRIVRAEPTSADVAAGLPGSLRLVDSSRGNFGQLKTSGVDLEASYEIDTGFGRFTPHLSVTWVNEFESSDLPGMPRANRVAIASPLGTIPRWRAVASVGWSRGALNVSATARYVPSYTDAVGVSRSDRVVPSQTLADVQAWVDLDDLGVAGSSLQGIRAAVGVQNLFDSEPRFSEANVVTGYDLSQGDLRQRFGYFRLSKRF
ncbi:MAG: TonB-dependent receptor [Steroidobacter sp.]